MNKVSPDVYERVMQTYGYRCVECGTAKNVELCHKLAKHGWRLQKYPLFMNSPMNLSPRCGGMENNCHAKYNDKYRVTDREAELYEWWLRELKEET